MRAWSSGETNTSTPTRTSPRFLVQNGENHWYCVAEREEKPAEKTGGETPPSEVSLVQGEEEPKDERLFGVDFQLVGQTWAMATDADAAKEAVKNMPSEELLKHVDDVTLA